MAEQSVYKTITGDFPETGGPAVDREPDFKVTFDDKEPEMATTKAEDPMLAALRSAEMLVDYIRGHKGFMTDDVLDEWAGRVAAEIRPIFEDIDTEPVSEPVAGDTTKGRTVDHMTPRERQECRDAGRI